jgi:hypothetical protein
LLVQVTASSLLIEATLDLHRERSRTIPAMENDVYALVVYEAR